MTTPERPTDDISAHDTSADEMDEVHPEHDSKTPALEDEPTADEPAPMAGDADLQAGHLLD